MFLTLGAWKWCWLCETDEDRTWRKCEGSTSLLWFQPYWCHTWIQVSFWTFNHDIHPSITVIEQGVFINFRSKVITVCIIYINTSSPENKLEICIWYASGVTEIIMELGDCPILRYLFNIQSRMVLCSSISWCFTLIWFMHCLVRTPQWSL